MAGSLMDLPAQDGEKKQKYPRADAIAAARDLVRELKPYCTRLIVAGSLRRRKALVGDVEIVYVPVLVPGVRRDFFSAPELCNCVDARLDYLVEQTKLITHRLNREGRETWGPKNKLAVHVASGIPVDLFATSEESWWNYLVCRTGPAEGNVRIASAAQARGWKWNPYGVGFTNAQGELVRAESERAVFELVGLKYLEPWER